MCQPHDRIYSIISRLGKLKSKFHLDFTFQKNLQSCKEHQILLISTYLSLIAKLNSLEVYKKADCHYQWYYSIILNIITLSHLFECEKASSAAEVVVSSSPWGWEMLPD